MQALMGNVYFYCALVGGTILVVQTILILVGGAGGDVDVDADVDLDDLSPGDAGHGGLGHGHAGDAAEAFFKVLSFKTLVAFVTFFGLAGLAGARSGLSEITTLVLAAGAGALALYGVAYLMSLLHRLQSKGNVDLRNAVGKRAQVYLVIPARSSGAGKVLVSVQGRRVECKAVTSGAEIPTGQEVEVVELRASDTLGVVPVRRE